MDFKAKFNKTAVLDFLKNQFLPDDFLESRETVKFGQLSFAPDRIKEIEFIGESSSLALKLYIIRHEAENDPRVTLSRETFRVMSNLGAQRALVVFYSTSSDNYRLSLATITLALKGAKTKREYSNPRRYSFFLGSDAKTHTPEQFLSKKVSDFDDLLKRFSIEVVNKEFYNEIAIKFTELVGGKRRVKTRVEDFKPALRLPGMDLSKPESHIAAQEFAVRLIGRVVFCWFLKKKKSPGGESLLPESVLSSSAMAACEKAGDNYYHSVLENLFFQVLNTEMPERAKEFKKSHYDKIPFLNGGLFEPHDGDFYDFDAVTVCSKHLNTLKIPNVWFKGLIDILETYNFTIDENTSVDVELAVDPEMLGRIFENLLAEINPETGETARKSTGSYYTPRPIVEYMVDESLKQYLKTKTAIPEDKLSDLLSYSESDTDLSAPEKGKIIAALDEVKIIDPACGSGAFPMGMLQKIVLVLQKVDPESEKWLEKQVERIPDTLLRKQTLKQLKTKSINYIRKMGVLRDCIYGVDIQETAAEISKLRFFLSLIIDETVDDAAENRGIEPLPNLEFKFVCANTLILLPGSDAPALYEDETSIKKLKNLREQYFRSSGKDKKALKEKFSQEQTKIFNKLLLWHHSDTQSFQLSTWKPFENKPSGWFDPDWMFGIKSGFDIVIANPPYVRQEDIKEFKPVFKEQYECFTGIADLYVYFYECSFKLLKDNGILTFISSNKYFRAGYGEKLRGFLAKNSTIHQLIDFGDAPVFTAIAYPSIIVLSKAKPLSESKSRVFSWDPAAPTDEFVGRFNSGSFLMPQAELKSDGWRLESQAVLKLLEKLRKAGKPLSEYVNGRFYYGIKTGLNEAFVVDRATRDRLIAEHKSSAEVLKPFLRGRDVKRWRVKSQDLWLIFTRRGIDIKKYPAIHEYLKKYKQQLIPGVPGGRKPGSYEWYEIQDNIAYWKEFEQPKIIIPAITSGVEYAYDNDGYFSNDKTSICVTEKANYLLALLNSKVLWWFIRQTAASKQGGFYEFKPMYVSQLPIVENRDCKVLEKLTDKILISTHTDPAADVSAVEREIDQLVYKLYHLTPDEIKIIEETK